MKPKASKEVLDCVEMKERIQAAIDEHTKNLSPEQEIAYYEQALDAGPLADWWQQLRSAASNRSARRGIQR